MNDVFRNEDTGENAKAPVSPKNEINGSIKSPNHQIAESLIDIRTTGISHAVWFFFWSFQEF